MTEPSRAVFLSYASQDAEAAAKICASLRAGPIEVWFDQSELRGGDAWDQKIRQQIKDCALFIPIISRNTQSRPEGYFRLEWRLADQRTHLMGRNRPFLLPVCIDQTSDVGADTPDSFQAVQWSRLPAGETPAAFVERVSRLLSDAPHSPPVRLQARPDRAAASATPRRSALALLLIAAVALIAAGYFAVDQLVLSRHGAAGGPAAAASTQIPAPPHSEIAEKSIAVLPFVDMSEKRDQEYFSDGLSEELINQLAQNADLKVIARTSSFQFKAKNEDIRSIAGKLGVANVLEGSVRKSGDRLRITAQLIRASDGAHVWSSTYDRRLNDVFKVQSEIAATVARALNAALDSSGSAATGTQNVEAYNLLLKGNFFTERGNAGDYKRATEQYRQALKLDPNFSLAWTRLASSYLGQAFEQKVSPAEAESMARAALQRALAIDPKSAAAHRILAFIYKRFDWNWAEARKEYERALALDPSGQGGRWARIGILEMTMWKTGRYDELLPLLLEDQARNPLDVEALSSLGLAQYYAGQANDAATSFRRAIELNPSASSVHFLLSLALLLSGKTDAAFAAAQDESDEESKLVGLAVTHWALGRRTDSDAALHTLESKFAGTSAYDIALAHAYRGEANATVTWLDRAYRQHDTEMPHIKVSQFLRPLQGDPRVKALVAKMKLED